MLLDIIVGIALVYAIYKGAKDGLFVSVAAFLALLIGIIGALKFSYIIKNFLFNQFGWESSFLPVVAFILTFFIAVLIVKVIAKLITKLFEAVFLGFLNRLFGAVFQILVVVLLVSVFLSLFDQINAILLMVNQESLMNSISYRTYLVLSDSVFPSFFELVKALFEKSIDVIKTPMPLYESESV